MAKRTKTPSAPPAPIAMPASTSGGPTKGPNAPKASPPVGRWVVAGVVVAVVATMLVARPWASSGRERLAGTTPSSGPTAAATAPATAPSGSPYRAFTDTSYWNTPLPPDAPVDPSSHAIISFLTRDNANPFVMFTGTGPGGRWGHPIYWAKPSDPSYDIRNSCSFVMPPEFGFVRIPKAAHPDPGSDSDMTVYDLQRGVVYALWHAEYDPVTGHWSSCGGTAYYLDSNGLDGRLAQTDQPANTGHRGLPPTTYAVRWDEIQSGHIDHILRINVNTTGCAHVFPMTGDECGSRDPDAPPEGTRIRIDPSIDLSTLHLSPAALIVAQALQRYGAIVGDQTGGSATIQVEGVVLEGRGWLWKGVLGPNALHKLPFSDFQVIQAGYGA